MKSVVITSTGRSGTTFLILLYTYLGFKTGFDDRNMKSYIYTNCNSGLEKGDGDIGILDIVKNPLFLYQMGQLNREKISWVVIPVRDFRLSAKSRHHYATNAGGLFGGAKDVEQQIAIYNAYMSRYIQDMVKYDLPTIFLDFDKMVKDSEYLYNKLKVTFTKDLSIAFFENCYQRASEHQSKRTPVS